MDEKEILEQTGVDSMSENVPDENIEEQQIIDTVVEDAVEKDVVLEPSEVDDSAEIVTEVGVEVSDSEDYVEELTEEFEMPYEVPKKKMGLQKPIIIACCILLCAIIGFSGFVMYGNLFGNNITGNAWVLAIEASADEATEGTGGNGVTYFTFGNNGDAYLTLGSMTVIGTWSYNTEDAQQIDVSISYFFNGTFTVDVEGNAFTGRTLSLSNEYGVYEFIGTTIPPMYAEKDENAKIEEKLLGQWNNVDSGITYTFNADGTCVINQSGALMIDGVYTIKDNSIVMSYISNEKTDNNFEFEIVDESNVVIAGLEFTKVN